MVVIFCNDPAEQHIGVLVSEMRSKSRNCAEGLEIHSLIHHQHPLYPG